MSSQQERKAKPEFTRLHQNAKPQTLEAALSHMHTWQVREILLLLMKYHARPKVLYNRAVGKGGQESLWTPSISTMWWPAWTWNLWRRSYSLSCSTFKLPVLLSALSTLDCSPLQSTIYTSEHNPNKCCLIVTWDNLLCLPQGNRQWLVVQTQK